MDDAFELEGENWALCSPRCVNGAGREAGVTSRAASLALWFSAFIVKF